MDYMGDKMLTMNWVKFMYEMLIPIGIVILWLVFTSLGTSLVRCGNVNERSV